MRKLRSGEGRARTRTHTSRHPVQGSSFHSMGWVSPTPHWFTYTQRGPGPGPKSRSKSCIFPQHPEASPCCFQCLWVDSTPGEVRGEGGGAPSGVAKDTASIFQGNFQKIWALSAGLRARGAPRGSSFHYKKGQSRTLANSPFSRVCPAPRSSHMPFYLIPTPIS